MGRIIKMIVKCIFKLPKFFRRVKYMANHMDEFTEKERYEYIREMGKIANKAGNVTIDVKGLEDLPPEDGFMIYPNHQGVYDVIGLMEALDRPFSFVYKKELDKVPFIKRVYRAMDAVALDREDVRHGLRVMNYVTEEVKKGRNYVIFPEGTRNKDENNVHEFKAGCFKVAMKAKCPIVPVAQVDAYKVFDEKGTAPVTVKLRFLPPIPYEEYKGMKTVELAAYLQKLIQDTVNEELAAMETDSSLREES